MVFDSTVVAVRISSLNVTMVHGGATLAIRSIGAALMMGHENLDAADITDGPESSNVGPPWMWHAYISALVPAVASSSNFNLVTSAGTGGILVKSKRKLTENNKELFLVTSNTIIAADDSSVAITGYFRVLIRIP